MSTHWVIKHLDVIEDIRRCGSTIWVDSSLDSLLLQQAEEAPRRRCHDSFRVDSCSPPCREPTGTIASRRTCTDFPDPNGRARQALAFVATPPREVPEAP